MTTTHMNTSTDLPESTASRYVVEVEHERTGAVWSRPFATLSDALSFASGYKYATVNRVRA